MALYAFDGTWNRDEPNPTEDTNVVRFRDAYQMGTEYIEGIGTRHGKLGRIIGGLTGAGGRRRIEEMYHELADNYRSGDPHIDVVGFSRGAALAVHFTNVLENKGIELESGEVVVPRVRFLGLWDTVATFGIPINMILPFQEINIGWQLEVPVIVDHCFHAMALDERRQTFVVTRLDPGDLLPNVEEMWFRGVHSDVGGGNGNVALSSITLKWMLEKARDCGLPVAIETIAALEQDIDPTAPLGENLDLIKNPKRKVRSADHIHPSAEAEVLATA